MAAQNYLEQDFETHIEAHLLSSGYLKRLSQDYDKSLCLIPDEFLAFIQATQPLAFQRLQRQYGTATPHKLVERLSKQVQKYGALHVLRTGFKDRGEKFQLAYFKPASGMNPEHHRLYQSNRFSIIRQLKYSQKNENAIDIVLFINGLPIITAELKNALTGQMVEQAIQQYRKDRRPNGEPLLAFKRCLVHFAVGNEEAFMTTHLQGDKTRFFPFNKDTINPVNPHGHKTHYLWEDIWQPDTLLELLRNYLHLQTITEKVFNPASNTVEEKSHEAFIFPRYHQLDVVRFILGRLQDVGVGYNFLVQHSAGSGKSNSIAWLAHQLASYYQHPTDTERLFDSIIVVTDRRVLDRQLQNTVKQFEQTEGVVCKIEKNSAQLRTALESGRAIIISTLQKFPVISESMTALKGKRFAVIIDEAHSSQSGESARHLKKTLSVNLEDAEAEDKTGNDLEDKIIQEIRNRGPQKHISYFAFTATPKNKTLELFGTKDAEGKPVAHHIYSMRQAIEEGFILDVLKNYTTFARYFKLVKTIPVDNEYEKKKAIRLLMSHVDLSNHAIEQKTRIMLDHFIEKTANAIQGQGRAMVVTRSRLHAVRFYHKFVKVMREKQLPYKPLVAFSGEVSDPDTGEKCTENSLNHLPSRVAIEDALKTPDYRILVVANKYQTGFDEPFLHTMYVDKRLAGVQAVQTLSRLNRTHPGKTDTFILDFVNDSEDIQNAFQPYFQTTRLEEETEPNKLYEIQAQLETYEVYTADDIEEFAEVFYARNLPLEKLQPVLDRAVFIWRNKTETEREDFRSTLQKYVRLYGFLSQIITFTDTDLEKLYTYAKALNRKLPRREIKLPFEVLDAVDLESLRLQETFSDRIPISTEEITIPGIGEGSPVTYEDERDVLSAIIKSLNETYGINLTPEDRLDIQRIKEKLDADENLTAVLVADNTREAKENKFNETLDELLLNFVHTKLDLYKKLTEPNVNQMLKRQWFETMAS
ncbi:MAG: type I restriction endonuclease subunit R [Brevefilum sp.]|jgi:type I restriction enzyme R subunit